MDKVCLYKNFLFELTLPDVILLLPRMLPAGLLALLSACLLPVDAAKTALNVTFPNASTTGVNSVNDNFLGISFELSPFNTQCKVNIIWSCDTC